MTREDVKYSIAFLKFMILGRIPLEEELKMSVQEHDEWMLKEKEREQMFALKWKEEEAIRQAERQKQQEEQKRKQQEQQEEHQNNVGMWRLRINEPMAKLKEIIEWLFEPPEWTAVIQKSCYTIQELKQIVYCFSLELINENGLQSVFDRDSNNYYVSLLQLLICYDLAGIKLPEACSDILEETKKRAFLLEISQSIKCKLSKTIRSLKIKKKRHDQMQNEQLLEAAKTACDERGVRFDSYNDLLQCPVVKKFIESMTDAKGKPKIRSSSSLNRLLSPYVSNEAKCPGRRPKKF